MLPQNRRLAHSGKQNNPGVDSQLITRRSIVLGMLVALVPIIGLVVTVLGTLLTMLSHSS